MEINRLKSKLEIYKTKIKEIEFKLNEMQQHITDLSNLFGIDNPFVMYNKLYHLEKKAHFLMEKRCNGTTKSEEEQENIIIFDKLDVLLNFREQNILIFWNSDLRGYALKISEDWMDLHSRVRLYRDWGSNDIIVQSFYP